MVSFPNFLFDLEGMYSFATSQGYIYWINLGISIILSTIIGGIVLIIVAKTLSKWTGNISNYSRVFMLVLIVNVINFFGFLGVLLPFLTFIPILGSFIAIALPLLVWIVLLKLMFGELTIKGVVILGIVSLILSFTVIPIMVTTAGSFIGI